ncbi:MAG: RNase adapter RapZ [Xanthomonadales bacterium]
MSQAHSDQLAQRLILVSGLSGSGKSTALRALEDQGCYCVDNLPAALLKEFAQQIGKDPALYSTVALGVDARSRDPELEAIPAWLDARKEAGFHCQLLFLTADTKAIIKRFSETRRRHPLTSDQCALPQAIEKEKRLLEPLQRRADWIIDTSDTNIHQLKRQVWNCLGGERDSMMVVLESFAYKRGIPQDVDFVFDARNLPNPYWVEELRDFSGLDSKVRQWLESNETVDRMYADIEQFLLAWLPDFRNSQRSYVTVGIGCTGGKHRSVYLVDRLAKRLRSDFGRILVHHRELQS